MTMRRNAELALVPVVQHAPAQFEAWPDDVRERCRELWSSVGNRNASRVEWLYAREVTEGVSVPAAATIRTWARADDWESWANGELQRTLGKTFKQLQRTWLQALLLSQEVQLDILAGMYDDNPTAAAVKAKVAESVQRIIAQAGLLPSLPAAPADVAVDFDALSLEEQEAMMREALQTSKRQTLR
jgi:hypothetical protein